MRIVEREDENEREKKAEVKVNTQSEYNKNPEQQHASAMWKTTGKVGRQGTHKDGTGG